MDSLTDGYLNSHELANCFGAGATLEKMLVFEAALARTQAALGIIPDSAASIITATCDSRRFAIDELQLMTAESTNPAVGLVKLLRTEVASVDPAASGYVHWGSTSQDVVDTAGMLQCRDGIELLDQRVREVIESLVDLVRDHRRTPMVARTLSQHASPTTFGYKAAIWLQGMLDGHTRLRRLAEELPLQLGGGAETLAALGNRGIELRQAMAVALALRPRLPWHTDRTPVRELASSVGMLAASAGKIATDLLFMMQTDVAELREMSAAGRGESSTFPQKRNPVASIAVSASARRVPGFVATLFANFDHENERAAGAWQSEWLTIRDLFTTVGAALEQLGRALTGLEVDDRFMRENLDRTRGLVMTEAVVNRLATKLGRDKAQSLVKAAAAAATLDGSRLEQVLAENETVLEHLGTEGLASIMDPMRYTGAIEELIDEVMQNYDEA